MSSKYVPPHLRNKVQGSEPETQHEGNRQRNNNRSFNNNRAFNNRKNQEKIEEEKRELEKKKQLENTDINFPSLGNTPVKPKTWNGQRSFATLANEWKTLTEEQKEEEECKKIYEIRNSVKIITPRFQKRTYNTETYYEEEEVPTVSPPVDEWKTVDKKVHVVREKTIDEMEEEEQRNVPQDDFTIWGSENQPAEHETYWDERRY